MAEQNPVVVDHGDEGLPEKYIEIPRGPYKRQEPVIKGKGVPVWVLVAYHQQHGMTPEQISALWLGELTPDEVRAALLYGKAHPDQVPNKTLG